MKTVRALMSFAGAVSMIPGETRAVSDELAADLIQAGYAQLVKEKKAIKGTENETERTDDG